MQRGCTSLRTTTAAAPISSLLTFRPPAHVRNLSCTATSFFFCSSRHTRIATYVRPCRYYSTDEKGAKDEDHEEGDEKERRKEEEDEEEEEEEEEGDKREIKKVKLGPAYKVRFQGDKVDPKWRAYHEVLNNFMERLIHKQRLGYKWWTTPVSPKECFPWVDEDKFPGGVTRVPMTSFAPDKVVRQVLIDWHNWKMKIQQVDLVDGYLSEERVIDIPADWLFAMKVMHWPGPEAKIQQYSTKSVDLYAYARERKQNREELGKLHGKVSELLEELKEDTTMRLV